SSSLTCAHTPPPGSPLFPYTTLFRSRTCAGATRNMTRLGGIVRPPHSRSRRGYFAWKRSTSARRSGPSARNSALPSTVTPRSSRSEEHTSEFQSRFDLVCRLLLEKKNEMIVGGCQRRSALEGLALLAFV